MVNIFFISQINDVDTLDNYLRYLGIDFQAHEIEDIRALCHQFVNISAPIKIFDNYVVGYKIPQISKEFDLLRINDGLIVNIELKTEQDPDKTLRQLKRNRYYLKPLLKSIRPFSFISSNGAYFANSHQITTSSSSRP